MKLMREIRFSAVPPQSGEVLNSWAGWPPAERLAPYLRAQVVVEGPVDAATGYVCNIKDLDRVIRDRVVPLFADAAGRPCEAVLQAAWTAARGALPRGCALRELRILPTPYLIYAAAEPEPAMIQLTQTFEFSAAHRLHAPGLSDADNREIFGKCANAHGHGHNYVLEVTVAGRADPQTGVVMPLPRLERVVRERVIERFDHRHLNLDCAEFAELNPSVENIAAVIWELLSEHVSPAELRGVRVWETPKTCAEIRAGER